MARQPRCAFGALLAAAAASGLSAALARAFLAGPRAGPPARRLATARRAAGPTTAPAGQLFLRYFNGRGVAETARMLMVLGGEDFEDFRYKFSFGVPGDMSTIIREEFDADRAAGKMQVGMGKVPILEAGDFKLPQSKTIERYLAKKFGLMGGTLEEEAWIDAVGEHIRDIMDAFKAKGLFGMQDAEKKKEILAKWFGEELPPMLKKLDAALPGSEGFAVGTKLSLADVQVFRLLRDTWMDEEGGDKVGEGCAKLQAIADSVAANAAIAEWIAKRPQTAD